MNLKKFFLYTLIISVAISALFGIAALLTGNFGETEIRILFTMVVIAATSILGLACGAYFETGRGKIIPVGGIAAAVLAAAISLPIIWIKGIGSDDFAKAGFTAMIVAVACAHVSLVLMARLDRRFRWSLLLVYISDAALAGIVLFLLWFTPKGNNDLLWRVLGVLSITSAAMTIITPVFHRLSQKTIAAADIDAEIAWLKKKIEELERRKAVLI